jgi:hypothetical protein
MGFISGYPKDSNISLSDKLIGTDAENALATKNFEIGDFITFVGNNLPTKEDIVNKSTNTGLGGNTPSDILYPTQKAVKTYVDGIESNLGDAIFDLNQDVAGLNSIKENIANKSTNVSLGTSDILYPTQNAVKAYVDANASGASIIKMEKTIIYSSEILDLHNTKIKIITGEAGKIKYLNSYVIDYEFGSVVYTKTGSGNLALYYGSYGQIGNIQNPFVGATESRKYQFNHFPQLDMQYFSGQENINIGLASGTYNDGDGNITIYAVYTEITL